MNKAVQSVKETAANMTAKVEEKLDKSKASVAEKGEKLTAHDKAERTIAHEKKEAKQDGAEMREHEKRAQNAADARASKLGLGADGMHGHPTAALNTNAAGDRDHAVHGGMAGHVPASAATGTTGSAATGANTDAALRYSH